MRCRVILAALFVAASLLGTIEACIAAPPLWVVRSANGKVYLFGTVHIISDTVQWRSPELEAAMAQSQDLYLEIANANDIRKGAAQIFELGIDRDHPLSSELPAKDVALLDIARGQAATAGAM